MTDLVPPIPQKYAPAGFPRWMHRCAHPFGESAHTFGESRLRKALPRNDSQPSRASNYPNYPIYPMGIGVVELALALTRRAAPDGIMESERDGR